MACIDSHVNVMICFLQQEQRDDIRLGRRHVVTGFLHCLHLLPSWICIISVSLSMCFAGLFHHMISCTSDADEIA